MGRDKALLPFNGAPLVAHIAQILAPIFPEIIVVTANENIARAADLPAVADTFANRGPLGGIHAALTHFERADVCRRVRYAYVSTPISFALLCADFDGSARVPLSDNGFEPLHAVYAATAADRCSRIICALKAKCRRYVAF